MAKKEGPIHIRVALWDTITGLIEEHQKVVREFEKKDFSFPAQDRSIAAQESRGAIKGLRSILHTLKDGIIDDLKDQLEDLHP